MILVEVEKMVLRNGNSGGSSGGSGYGTDGGSGSRTLVYRW